MLRTVEGLPYEEIAGKVVNLSGEHPTWPTIRTICNEFSVKKGCRPYKYHKSGRKPWKMTSDIQTYVLRRLVADRIHHVVTSSYLAALVAANKGVVVEASSIRKLLLNKGYKWLPRRQRRQYSKEQRAERMAFCRAVLRLSKKDLRHKLAMSLDGTVFSMPPEDETDRRNYCWGGVTHMWRKPGEANCPKLAGADDYTKQVPLARALPMWGGCSEDGFAVVVWHTYKKLTSDEGAAAVKAGNLTEAIRTINPNRRSGPWTVLCDGETFLRANVVMKLYASKKVRMWDVPPHSPDLNPIEMYWGWLKGKLRRMDLEDLKKKRKPLDKMAYKLRIRKIMKTDKSQAVAKACARKFRSVCQQILKKNGAAFGS